MTYRSLMSLYFFNYVVIAWQDTVMLCYMTTWNKQKLVCDQASNTILYYVTKTFNEYYWKHKIHANQRVAVMSNNIFLGELYFLCYHCVS